MDEPVSRARRMLEDNQYLTLATSDASGRPWASTVWYAARQASQPDDRLVLELVWLSMPAARHSRNILERPEVGVSIFDSGQPAGAGDGLQLSGCASLVPPDELDDAVADFSTASLRAGGTAWTRARVEEPAIPRLYVVRLDAAYVLGNGTRVEVPCG